MSVSTLENLGINPILEPAVRLLDLNFEEQQLLGERTRLTTHQFGYQQIGDEDVYMQRVHSGVELVNGFDYLPTGRGGVRLDFDPDFSATNDRLAFDMTLKLAARRHTTPDMDHGGIYFTGAKGFIVANARRLGVDGIGLAVTTYAQNMHERGLGRHTRDGVAGDMNTNGYTDKYVIEIDRLNEHAYPYWRATGSGKKPENGGLEFRTAATGAGTYFAHKAFLVETGRLDEENPTKRTLAVQGGGNVAAWYAYYASNDPTFTLNHWSDADGTIRTPDPRGFNVTREMVEQIGDNPLANGRRIQLYTQALRERHQELYGEELELYYDPNPDAIIDADVDDFMPAARPSTVHKDNVHRLRVKGIIVEGGNDPLDADALAYCETNQIPVVRGHIANSGGTDISIAEIKANILEVDFPERTPVRDWTTLENGLMVSTRTLIRNVLAWQSEFNTDLDTASNVVAVNNLVRYELAA